MAAGNCVAKLNEFAQRTRSVVTYEDVGAVGPDHIKTFTIRAVVNGKEYPTGVGKNKKEAKQNAAKNALQGLQEESAYCTEEATDAPAAPVLPTHTSNINYICWLNEYGHKCRLLIRAEESTRLGLHTANQFVVGDKEYPEGYGKTKKEAKEEAAKLVYHEICGSKATETGVGTSSQQKEELKHNVSEICDKTKKLNMKTDSGSFAETNFIGMVNHYCQKTHRTHTFIEEARRGPPHNPQFFYKLLINNKEYPVGEGKNVKEAKQNAAQLAWSALQEQSDWDSKITFCSALSDDSVPARPLTRTPGPTDAKPITTQKTPSSSASTNPLNAPQDQDQSPGVKSRIRLAANFQNVRRQSKENIIVNFDGKNKGSEKSTTQSSVSRFTSDFDSIEQLDRGAFGRVYKARGKLLDKYCAVKIVRCKQKSLREVAALSELLHCNIVRYYTCWMEDSGYQWDSTADSSSGTQSTSNSSVKYLYIQMELCDTKTLKVWIDEKNIHNEKKSLRDSKRREEGLTIAQQIVSGVEYIHSKMFIHRDLKPANIMFGREGEVKIGDFGLVTAENNEDSENVIERTVYKGTPSYMAPEQKSRKSYDRKVDIFALGLIYFELLCKLPFEKKEGKHNINYAYVLYKNNMEQLVARRSRQYCLFVAIWDNARNQILPQKFLSNFHQESQIIKSMLCVKPEDRPEASKVKTDLEECAHTLTNLKTMHYDNKTF